MLFSQGGAERMSWIGWDVLFLLFGLGYSGWMKKGGSGVHLSSLISHTKNE